MEQSHYTDANGWSDNHEVPQILRNPQFRCRAISLCSENTRKIQEKGKKKINKYRIN
jgi:hypothetical protein